MMPGGLMASSGMMTFMGILNVAGQIAWLVVCILAAMWIWQHLKK
jgi:hypothetical protein